MSKKLGFALGASGSRGVAHIGFLKAMEEGGIKADYVAGTSMGSVVGACYSAGYTADFMQEEIKKMSMSDIFDLSFNPFGNGALLRAQKMRKKLSTYFTDCPTFNDLSIPFKSVAVDLWSGNLKVFSGNEDVAEGVAASSTIPGVFKPIVKNGMTLVDGGIRCRVPVDQVREMGADVVVAVDVLGGMRPQTKKYNIITLMFRAFEVMDADLTEHKINLQKPDFYIRPELGNMDQYKFKDLDFAFEKGYEIGKANIDTIKKMLK